MTAREEYEQAAQALLEREIDGIINVESRTDMASGRTRIEVVHDRSAQVGVLRAAMDVGLDLVAQWPRSGFRPSLIFGDGPIEYSGKRLLDQMDDLAE